MRRNPSFLAALHLSSPFVRQESPDKLRGASVDAAWTQAVVPELPSGLREDRSTVATGIADLIRQVSRADQP